MRGRHDEPPAPDGATTRNELFSRITADPRIFGGKPVVRGLRISVEMIVALLAAGETAEAILDDYPELEADDIRACVSYAQREGAGRAPERLATSTD